MDLVELRERIDRWEDLHTEFKERIDSPDDLAASLVAFANTDGGQLVFGVAKDRSVVGVTDPDAEHRQVDNVAYNNCEPPVTVVQEGIEIHSPGRAPNTVDEAAMRAGVHVVRNPRIYARLSDAGLVTRAGTGIRRIVKLVTSATGKDVAISLRDYEVLFTIPRPDPKR